MKKWFLDFNYDANPELAPEQVRDRLYDHIRTIKCTMTRKGKRVVFTNMDDAFRVRMDLDRYVTRTGRTAVEA